MSLHVLILSLAMSPKAPPTSLVDNELENRSATDMSTPTPSLEWESESGTGHRPCNRSVNIVEVDSERL